MMLAFALLITSRKEDMYSLLLVNGGAVYIHCDASHKEKVIHRDRWFNLFFPF